MYIKNKSILREKISANIKEYMIFIIAFGIFIIFSIVLFDKGFLTGVNILNIFRQTAMISVMAVGYTFVMATGEIDLSIGSTIALTALISAIVVGKFGILASLIAAVSFGALIGFINGFFVVKVKIPSFLATLAMMIMVQGFARWITQLRAISVTNKTFNFIFGGGNLGRVPILFIWTLLFIIIGHFIMVKTSFGRKVLATGGNQVAARFSGINTGNIKWLLFTVLGAIAAITGMLYTGRMTAARYSYGENDLFTIMAAVIIGGNSIYGGKGTVVGAFIGSIIIGMVNNGLILFGLNVDLQIIFKGAIILLAIILSPKE